MAPPSPRVATLAAMRPRTGRSSRRRSRSWKLRMYSSEVAGVAPLAKNLRARAARIRPMAGATALNQSDWRRTRAKITSLTIQSKRATAAPVKAPVITDSTRTCWGRRPSLSSSLKRERGRVIRAFSPAVYQGNYFVLLICLAKQYECEAMKISDALISEAELASRLRLSVTRLARRLRQQASAEAEVSPSQLATLASVERLGPITLGDLAAV